VQHGQLRLREGDVTRINVTVPDAATIAGEICPKWQPDDGRAPLFGVLRVEGTDRPAVDVQVEVRWAPPDGPPDAPGRAGAARVLSDWRGEFVVCDVVAGGTIRFRTTASGADWSDPIPAGRLLNVLEIAVDTASRRP
jgi:hypothetical protein